MNTTLGCVWAVLVPMASDIQCLSTGSSETAKRVQGMRVCFLLLFVST
jgi:hypothetical protein